MVILICLLWVAKYMINPGDIMIEFTAPEDRIIRSVSYRVTEKEQEILLLLLEDPEYTYVSWQMS